MRQSRNRCRYREDMIEGARMRSRVVSTLVLTIVITSTLSVSIAQSPKEPTATLERNIRAELGFLASDAMQGRGSGTNFERLAAEYIGSQFRQFGLEPGGDTDDAGNKTYVQRVPLNSGVVPTGEQRNTWNAI